MPLKVMGTLASDAQRFLDSTASSIAGFYDWVPVDGTLPIDRMALGKLWQQFMGQMRNIPQLMQQMVMWKLFACIGHLAGIRNIQQSKIPLMPPGGTPLRVAGVN